MLDIIIIVFLLFGALIGFKQGFTRALVNFVGVIGVLVLSFILKDPIADFMILNFPFFDFYGLLKGISVLNILVYEVIAFGLCFGILFIILKILMVFTNIFEKILSLTIILGFLSKILGCVLGLFKNYIIVFVVLFILSLPNFSDNGFVKDSNLRKPILENTPVLAGFTKEALEVFDEFASLKEKYTVSTDSNKFNYEALDLFLKYDVVRPDVVNKLIESDKLHVKGAKKLVEKYENS
ncbi:MAG: CvpA family protein [Bacilli bacterium]|nr:CvpA family protein [Bacilli bacterium]